MEAQAIYKSRSSLIHAQVKEAAFFFEFEEKIGNLIRGELVSTSPQDKIVVLRSILFHFSYYFFVD